LKPLKINIDAVDKSIPIPTPAKKKNWWRIWRICE